MRAQLAALLFALGAAVIWLYQEIEWLKTGFWFPQPVSKWLEMSGIDLPVPDSMQARDIVNHMLNIPVPLLFLGVAAVIGFLATR